MEMRAYLWYRSKFPGKILTYYPWFKRRYGTIADKMDGQLEEPVKAARSARLSALEKELGLMYQEQALKEYHMLQKKRKFLLGHMGFMCRCVAYRSGSVLFEEIIETGSKKYIVGYNERYIRIAVPAENIPSLFLLEIQLLYQWLQQDFQNIFWQY